ncbi:MAG: tetratricopeptide repeat protein [Litorilinea sp.]
MRLRTKIDLWLESVIEAGWLAALIIAPLFFNVFSSRVFEPDKISLIRTLALTMLLAWLIKLVNGGPAWLPAWGQNAESQPEANTRAVTDRVADNAADSAKPAPGRIDRRMDRRINKGLLAFLIPIGLLIAAYLISTALSVAPFVSWWGSYQRLQGTYTFLGYIIIALLTLGHLRTPGQLRRLQHAVILTSLPISIYGIVQHYAIDPLPWGGDVTTRVAANAGNAIFLAAYLIMAFFLTVERTYQSFAYLLAKKTSPAASSHDLPVAFVGGAYLFIILVQLLAIFWTQSRGPWLGLLAGTYLFILLVFTVLRPKYHRAFTTAWIGLGLAGALLLVAVNTLPMFESWRDVPYVGRLTTLLEADDGTGRVRVLIWQGAAEMVAPHEPLHFPDGSRDGANLLRPLVGYGPEAMWIAYNPFYPPELAHLESRNASPDRAHNETWDSLVVTGIFGFIAYTALFMTIFYWALRWLGLLTTRRHSLLFASIVALSSLALVVLFYYYDNGWRYFGVALPAGIIAGLGIYVTIAALFTRPQFDIARRDTSHDPTTDTATEPSERVRHLFMIAILAALVAHYVEIHFGIAIAATRVYFWIFTALLIILGLRWAQPDLAGLGNLYGTAGHTPTDEPVPEPAARAKGRRRGGRTSYTPRNESLRGGEPSSLPGILMGDVLIFLTMVFVFTTNSQSLSNGLGILIASITQRVENGAAVNSPAIFFLLMFTWIIAATIALVNEALQQPRAPRASWWLWGFGTHGVVVGSAWFIYGALQGSRLTPAAAGSDLDSQLGQVAGHFAVFTWLLVIWLGVAALLYAWPWLRDRRIPTINRAINRAAITAGAGALLTVLIFMAINNFNIGLVRADIIYKQGQQFDSQSAWVDSTELYRRALDARRTEDHYMLFLGRSLLEHAKSQPVDGSFSLSETPDLNDVLALTPDVVSIMGRADTLRAAEAVLLEAQSVNPLNTDHTANLARLYRTWADLTEDAELRQTMLDQSVEAYETALQLSPNAAHLWNETGNAYMARGEREAAEAAYLHSFDLDQRFDQTYVLLADFYEQEGDDARVIELLQQGVEAVPRSAQLPSYLGVVLARQGDLQGAADANLRVLELQPNNMGAMRNLALLYRDLDEMDEATEWVENAIAATNPNNVNDVVSLRQLAVQLYQAADQMDQVIVQYEQLRQLEPENTNTLRTLYSLYMGEESWNNAIEVLQNLATLEPNNFEHPLGLAQILQQVGQAENALAFANQALELAPDEQKPIISQYIETLDTGS